MGEDLVFNLEYMKYVFKGKYINKSLYYYDRTYSTLTHQYYQNICEIKEEMIIKCKKLLELGDFDYYKDFELYKIDILTNLPKSYLRYMKQYFSFRKKDICTINLDLLDELNSIQKFFLKNKLFICYGILKRLKVRKY